MIDFFIIILIWIWEQPELKTSTDNISSFFGDPQELKNRYVNYSQRESLSRLQVMNMKYFVITPYRLTNNQKYK